MTEPESVKAYVDAVRQALGNAGAERFLAEIHDHLLESVAAGLERGLTPEAAEARALERFGPPAEVAHQYAGELAEARWDKRLPTLRWLAAGLGLLSLYYLRFFVAVRQETSTLVQIGILLLGVLVLLVPTSRLPAGAGWFRGRGPGALRVWAPALVAVCLAATVCVWSDRGSHSASDTLNRSVPAICLLAALALRGAQTLEHSALGHRPA
jgi:HAAS